MYNSEIKTSLEVNLKYFVKWTVISCLIGGIVGVIGSVFGYGVKFAASFFNENKWVLFLLPVSGVIIVWLYHVLREDKNRGTNMVIESISSGGEITIATAPLIFLSTILTHISGGSAGREGAALQLGGSLGQSIGKLLHLDEKDKKIAVMCGMSAAFAALFGTPLAAGVFSMEVISIGVMYYAALVPCIFSAFIGAEISSVLGLAGESFQIEMIPAFSLNTGLIIILLGILCAAVSSFFCIVLHKSEHLYKKYFPNPYIRVIVGGILVILLTLIVGNRDYNGGSIPLIERCMEGDVRYEAFLLKILFTAVTLGAGYKGGEIVPTLCVGATFGCAAGSLLGFAPSLCAACGMAAVFAGVTNCPVSTLLIAFELFGYEAMPYFAIVIAVSFTLSGYYGLYSSQKIVYSKVKPEYINREIN